MNRNHLHLVLSPLVVLIAIVACVLPGQVMQPAPDLNPNVIASAIAGTAQVAAEQTTIAQQPLVTETPAMTGTTIEQVQDGTTKYTDYDGGFEIIFPVGWLAVRPNSDEFNASLAGEGAANSMLHDQMTSDMAGYDANFDRLFAYIIRPDIKKNVLLGFSKLAWDSDDPIAMDNNTVKKLVDQLETSGEVPGFRASIVQLHEDSDIKMIEIGGRWAMSDGQGGTVSFFSTVYLFKPSSNSTVRIIFTYLQDYRDQISPDVESIIESIRIIP